MASIPDPSSEPFRFGQLIYDRRYRSMTIQVFAFIMIMAFLWQLGWNTVQTCLRLAKILILVFWNRALAMISTSA